MQRPRTAINLSQSLQQRLNSYALAASAAGVGVLALAQPAEAKIIYTHADKNIGSKTFLDLNHDGIKDFKFIYGRASTCVGLCTTTGVRHGTAFGSTNAWLSVFGVRSGNQIYGQGQYASALPAGVRIGPKGKFPGGNIMAAAHAINGTNSSYKGPWAGALNGHGVTHRYLGLRFVINGKTHFGWARFDVVMSSAAHIQATLTGYAYETVANKPIVTGKTKGPDVVTLPATLGHLARGASVLTAWRGQAGSN